MRDRAGAIRGTRELFGQPTPNAPVTSRRSAHPEATTAGIAAYGDPAGAGAARQHSPERSMW